MKPNSDTTPALYIGLDVHKEKTSVAVADPGPEGEVRHHGEVATTQVALDRLIRRIAKARAIPVSRISVCYEAGGCGMWIARMFAKMKVHCTVIAPSLISTSTTRLLSKGVFVARYDSGPSVIESIRAACIESNKASAT